MFHLYFLFSIFNIYCLHFSFFTLFFSFFQSLFIYFLFVSILDCRGQGAHTSWAGLDEMFWLNLQNSPLTGGLQTWRGSSLNGKSTIPTKQRKQLAFETSDLFSRQLVKQTPGPQAVRWGRLHDVGIRPVPSRPCPDCTTRLTERHPSQNAVLSFTVRLAAGLPILLLLLLPLSPELRIFQARAIRSPRRGRME